MLSFFAPLGNLFRPGAFLAGALLLSACEANLTLPNVSLPVASGPAAPLDVALLVPAGTEVAELSAIASALENSARLAAADLGELEINITTYNTQRDTATAVNAARLAVEAGADVILGPLDGESAAAVGLAMEASNTPVLSFSNNTAIAGGNVYLLGLTFENSATRLASYARGQGKSRVMVVHARNVSGEAGRAAVVQALAREGVALAAEQGYENSLQGVTNATSTIPATVRSSGADAIFLTSSTAGALPIFAELLPEAGLGPDRIQYIGLSRWDLDPRLFTMDAVQGGWFAMPDRARMTAFSTRYLDTYGSAPHPLAFTAYDGMAIIGDLWANGGQAALSQASLTRGNGFQGASGVLRLRADGTNERGLAVGTIREGAVVTIDAAPRAFGGAGF
ncbi:MAG: penicillin-binding protein activator [Pseudomonadota bacterium]